MPDFRYVGLEPVPAKRFGVAATAFGLGAGVTLALSGHDVGQALVAGALSAIASAFALRGAGAGTLAANPASVGSARMAIVPWGVLVEADESPRILRWSAVKRIELSSGDRARSQNLLVSIETERERFVGESRVRRSASNLARAPLDRMIEHVDAWASEQSAPIALALESGGEDRASIDEGEGWCGALLSAARG